jgi:hypothetical protein
VCALTVNATLPSRWSASINDAGQRIPQDTSPKIDSKIMACTSALPLRSGVVSTTGIPKATRTTTTTYCTPRTPGVVSTFSTLARTRRGNVRHSAQATASDDDTTDYFGALFNDPTGAQALAPPTESLRPPQVGEASVLPSAPSLPSTRRRRPRHTVPCVSLKVIQTLSDGRPRAGTDAWALGEEEADVETLSVTG